MLPLILLTFCSCRGVASGSSITITTPQEFVEFSNNVSGGSGYSKTTVYLGSDLDFDSSLSQQFAPIGNSACSFQGTFDGQGHIISNLALSSSSQYVGLFGYLNGATVRNVVMDSSCSVVSSSSTLNSDTGSVAGHCCYPSIIESIVNMASVTFTGSSENINFGGLVGRFISSNTVRNCVNYGPLTYSGTGENVDVSFGGVAGSCVGSDSSISIQNCGNYGTLTHDSTTSYALYMGGVVGQSFSGTTTIENCVSAGRIATTTQASTYNRIGSIVGYIKPSATMAAITHCLWTSDVRCDNVYSYDEASTINANVANSSLVTLNATTVSELNEHAETNNTWGKWVALHLNEGTVNSLAQDTLVVTEKHFPEPVKEGSTFTFWCTDARCAGRYYPGTTSITGITDLYAGWDAFSVTFDFGNGTSSAKNVVQGEKYGALPGGVRVGYTFVGWFTDENGNGDEVTNETTMNIADDHTLYALWNVNNYTITFILNNGESEVVKTFNYSQTVIYPEDPVKEGYSFNGWSENFTTMPAHNLNVTAQWVSEFVEIVFKKKGLNEEEIRALISEYTRSDDFTIERIEEDNDGTTVIIRFADSFEARDFVRDVNNNKSPSNPVIRVMFASYHRSSFVLRPSIFFVVFELLL